MPYGHVFPAMPVQAFSMSLYATFSTSLLCNDRKSLLHTSYRLVIYKIVICFLLHTTRNNNNDNNNDDDDNNNNDNNNSEISSLNDTFFPLKKI